MEQTREELIKGLKYQILCIDRKIADLQLKLNVETQVKRELTNVLDDFVAGGGELTP